MFAGRRRRNVSTEAARRATVRVGVPGEALKNRQRRRVASAHEAHEPATLSIRLARRQFGYELEYVAKIADVGHQVVFASVTGSDVNT